MIAKTEALNPEIKQIDDYLDRIDNQLKAGGIGTASRIEILAELKSHLTDRIAEFQQSGSGNPVYEAMAALGDPVEIASEFAVTAKVRAAGRSFSPARLLWAVWSVVRTFGRGLGLLVIAVAGYSVALGGMVAAIMKVFLPDRVGFWVGDQGMVWGISPDGPFGRELAGSWFIPVSVWIAIAFAMGTTVLLKRRLQSLVGSRRLRVGHA